MTLDEEERENLLDNATAFADRVLIDIAEENDPCFVDPVFVGLRPNGATSVYFGQDPVYHFNSVGQLRRAFVDGRLFKAEDGKLVALERHRSGERTQQIRSELLRTDFTTDQTGQFLLQLADRMQRLRNRLLSGDFTLLGEVTNSLKAAAQRTAVDRVRDWFEQLPAMFSLASSPRVV